MSRGETAPLGAERVAVNGYHYIKTPNGWKLKHHIIAEKTLERTIDTKVETVKFKDHDRHNFNPDNIIVEPKKGITKAAQKARLQSRIEELQSRIEELQAQLDDLEEDAS